MGNMHRRLNKNKIPAVSPSIPSKYQTVVIINDEKKGFLSQTRRFPSQLCLSDAPGPGSYGCVSSAEVCSPSFSKKGTSGFVASKTTRNFQKNSPGPNEYNLQSSLIKKSDFNAGASRVFRLPVAVQIEGPKDPTPAPNQYHIGGFCKHGEVLLSCWNVIFPLKNISRLDLPKQERSVTRPL
ncbi:O(6)-methylguanine-induced apoptosis 2 isoform X2 [Acanthochromis polyacanthus]|uniref:O(6)-methylguanine-induced apoptosis 2 isoform X2 n=1 Tax=Acanthochromis polyacanthus TaxID=80966 RepID=UPI00223420FF|nr:O(6)-methylguanine-induced apoptosis 2 isoform X2 [Acanthochromis polyacanthus]